MALSVDSIVLAVPDPAAARDFYASAFPATADSGSPTEDRVDLHGTGRLAFRDVSALAAEFGVEATTRGFRGFALGAIVPEPRGVRALVESAVTAGADVVKPAKKQLFGEFAASYRAPGGTVWKLAADSTKDSKPTPEQAEPPELSETAVYLGVGKPKASKAFYVQLGMVPEHDYGNAFVDFTVVDGASRLGLLPRKGLAKDVGVDELGDGFSGIVLRHLAATREDVDALLDAANEAGATVTAATEGDRGDYVGRFADPDGHHWELVSWYRD